QVVIEQFEIVIQSRFAADGRVEDDDLRAGLCADEVGCLAIEVRLHDDGLDVLLLDQIDDLQRMRRRGRNAGLWLDGAGNVQAEMAREVRPRRMIGYDL